MPLNYDPKSKEDNEGGGDWTPQAGTYEFKIDEFTPATFKSGNEGVKAKLLVDAGHPNGDSWSFDNISFSPKALWKMEELCKCIGVPFDPPPEPWEIEGKTGRAKFKTEQYNGRTNLRVKEYLALADPSDAEPDEPLPF